MMPLEDCPLRTKQNIALAIGTAVWGFLVIVGARLVLDYSGAEGVAARAITDWPAGTGVRRDRKKSTLVLVAHPHCPCTRASIGEMARILARCQGKLTARVLFYKPDGFDENWERTDIWRSAASIRDVEVIADPNGLEAKRFHASTSGQALLFGPTGPRLFAGGITASRGHAGDNDGEDAIISLVTTGRALQSTAPVYGCSILDHRSEEKKPVWDDFSLLRRQSVVPNPGLSQ
jgi:hypothetical protein